MFMGEAGREMVGKYAQDVTDYYCMASELDNHCVRESACHSIAEMAEKVQVVTEPCGTCCFGRPLLAVLYLQCERGNPPGRTPRSLLCRVWKRSLAFVFFFTKSVLSYLHTSRL